MAGRPSIKFTLHGVRNKKGKCKPADWLQRKGGFSNESRLQTGLDFLADFHANGCKSDLYRDPSYAGKPDCAVVWLQGNVLRRTAWYRSAPLLASNKGMACARAWRNMRVERQKCVTFGGCPAWRQRFFLRRTKSDACVRAELRVSLGLLGVGVALAPILTCASAAQQGAGRGDNRKERSCGCASIVECTL